MCWPRVCCRCPGRSALPWPPSLTFGRTPRRPPLPQLVFPAWNPGFQPVFSPPNAGFLPPPPSSPAPPMSPVIPRSRWDQRRQVRFNDPPPLVDGPSSRPRSGSPFLRPIGRAPMSPFLAPAPIPFAPGPSFPQFPQFHLSPELCSPRGAHPYLDWDITHFPSSAQLCAAPNTRRPAPLDGAATFPPTRLLTLSFADSPVLHHWEQGWGPIVARAQGAHMLTVEDVLDAVYRYFNTPLTPSDRASVSQHAWGVISDAYYARLPRSPNMHAFDASRGALRLDVLGGATKFSGLRVMTRDHVHLVLSL
ncbi:hypothetical protein B0H15DRAFT_852300 [Mycena belliarum]|uniref:DUF6699 domain-containing protein n=1 Tax=Mycena belliarum TaxID=1033014 RepID=A0AAD6U1E1_9AGAR|nr:hypothetical protein B0H15DRAFT_852300 [Mycena belliae]